MITARHTLIGVIALSQLAAANPVLTLEELDPDGKRHKVKDGNAVDVNSTVAIMIDAAELEKRAAASGSTKKTQAIVTSLTQIQKALATAETALTPLADVTAKWAKTPNDATRAAMMAERKKVADGFGAIAAAAGPSPSPGVPPSRLYSRISSALEASQNKVEADYAIVIDAVRAEIAALRDDLRLALKEEGLYVQLGAWVGTTQGQLAIHLPGFDDLVEGPANELTRVRLTLTDEQRKTLATNDELARSINAGKVPDALVQGVVTQANKAMEALLPESIESLKRANAALRAFETSATAEAAIVKTQLATVKAVSEELSLLLTGIATKYRQPSRDDAVGLLMATQDDLARVIGTAERVKASVEAAANAITAAGGTVASRGAVAANELRAAALALTGELKSVPERLPEGFAAFLGIQRAVVEAQAFSAEVRRLDLSKLPNETRMNLVTSGRRGAGDVVLVRLVMGRGQSRAIPVEDRSFAIQRVVAYIETVPGLVLVSAPQTNPPTNLRFRAAPAYSVLLKWGCRDNALWNTILTPGIALNVSAPDLDGDGTPELGLGLGISLLRDVLSVGGGYDVFLGEGFGFIGLNLPLATFGLPSAAASVAPGASH